ncbi:hypothetical protein H4R19_003012 [Coemansia spiralis]|nr:hypothetical protein H4R19_003012 [Coemansia spiralis]
MMDGSPFAPDTSCAGFAPSAPPSSRHRAGGSSRHGKLSSTGSSSSSSSLTTARGMPANTFGNRFINGVKALGVSEVVSPLMFIIANILHHYKHRTSETLVPYKPPPWMRYVKNFTLAVSSYRWLRTNGIVRPVSHAPEPAAVPTDGKRSVDASRSLNAATRHTSSRRTEHHHHHRSRNAGHSSSRHRSRGLDAAVVPQASHPQPVYADQMQQHGDDQVPTEADLNDFVMHMVAHIANGLFRAKGDGHGDEFDSSWAVPRQMAQEYHRSIFRRGTGLQGVEPHVLAGAAAIQALRNEGEVLGYHRRQYGGTNDVRFDFMLLGLALSETQALLTRKADAGAILGPTDSLEHVGRIALATVIKIKLDENTPAPVPAPALRHSPVPYIVTGRTPTPYPTVRYASSDATLYAAPSSHPAHPTGHGRCAGTGDDYRHATQAGVPPYIPHH